MVAEKGSFTQAAKMLGLTKSAISQHVSQLENDLDIRLLNRTTRGVTVTALGKKLLLRCHFLQDQVSMIFTDIANASNNPKGRFRVTCPHALEMNVVLPAIEQLCTEYPGLEPDIIVTDSSLDIVKHHLDVAIHMGELPDSGYRALPIGAIKEIFCATPLYLNKTKEPKNTRQLCQHRWIATSWQSPDVSVISAAKGCDQQQKLVIKLNQFAQVNSLPSAVEMALRHMGIVLLPDVIAKPLINKGELRHLLKDISGPYWPVYTIHAFKKEKPIQLTRFHQLVCRYFSSFEKS